jgi:hypothetical protein
MTPTTNSKNSSHTKRTNMALVAGAHVEIIRGDNRGRTGTFHSYAGIVMCRVILQGNQHTQLFRRTSVRAAIVIPIDPAPAVLNPIAVEEPNLEGPPEMSLETALGEIQTLKSVLNSLEQKLRYLQINQP